MFPTASLNRSTCSFAASILATNLLFCPVGANVKKKITRLSNVGFLLFFFPKRVEVRILLTIHRSSPVTFRKIPDPHSFSGADISQQLSNVVTRMKWKALRNYYINFQFVYKTISSHFCILKLGKSSLLSTAKGTSCYFNLLLWW